MTYNPKFLFQCKAPHSYDYHDLYPLYQSTFCGVQNAWINHNIANSLGKEYGVECVSKDQHIVKIGGHSNSYVFNTNTNQWVRRE